MKNTLVIEKEKIEQGDKLYTEFVSKLLPKGVELCTPRTNTLILFSLLKDAGEDGLLLKEMCEEVISSLPNEKIRVKNMELFRMSERLVRL